MGGKLVIVSAPSGAGKTTLVKHLLQQNLNLEFSISATSREARHNETHAKDYYFLTEKEFRSKIDDEHFLEWEEVYSGKFYGTLKSEIDRISDKGGNVIFDVDVVGGLNIKKQYSDKALAIFIQPPSVEELENRLRSRATDAEEVIQSRVDKAAHELTYAKDFDVVIVNDDLEKASNEIISVVSNFLDS